MENSHSAAPGVQNYAKNTKRHWDSIIGSSAVFSLSMLSHGENGGMRQRWELNQKIDIGIENMIQYTVVYPVLPDSSGDGRQSNTWRLFHLRSLGEGMS